MLLWLCRCDPTFVSLSRPHVPLSRQSKGKEEEEGEGRKILSRCTAPGGYQRWYHTIPYSTTANGHCTLYNFFLLYQAVQRMNRGALTDWTDGNDIRRLLSAVCCLLKSVSQKLPLSTDWQHSTRKKIVINTCRLRLRVVKYKTVCLFVPELLEVRVVLFFFWCLPLESLFAVYVCNALYVF